MALCCETECGERRAKYCSITVLYVLEKSAKNFCCEIHAEYSYNNQAYFKKCLFFYLNVYLKIGYS